MRRCGRSVRGMVQARDELRYICGCFLAQRYPVRLFQQNIREPALAHGHQHKHLPAFEVGKVAEKILLIARFAAVNENAFFCLQQSAPVQQAYDKVFLDGRIYRRHTASVKREYPCALKAVLEPDGFLPQAFKLIFILRRHQTVDAHIIPAAVEPVQLGNIFGVTAVYAYKPHKAVIFVL